MSHTLADGGYWYIHVQGYACPCVACHVGGQRYLQAYHLTDFLQVVVGGAAYAVGESVGHSKGKKEGTAEQAARDEKKFKDMHQKHENDRKRWNQEKQAYEDLLDETENKL